MGIKKSEASTTRLVEYLDARGGSTGKSTRLIAEELGVKVNTLEMAVRALQNAGWLSKRDAEGRLNLLVP